MPGNVCGTSQLLPLVTTDTSYVSARTTVLHIHSDPGHEHQVPTHVDGQAGRWLTGAQGLVCSQLGFQSTHVLFSVSLILFWEPEG